MNQRHGTHVILRAITPSYGAIDAEELNYPYLLASINNYNIPSFLKRTGFELMPESLDFRTPAVREDMRVAHLLSAAYRLQRAWSPAEKLFWSAQFTKTSVQLFGRPLSGETAKLAHDELNDFMRIAEDYPDHQEFFAPVLESYASLCTRKTYASGSIDTRYQDLMSEIRQFMNAQYHDVFHCFDSYGLHTLLTPEDLQNLFARGIEVLSETDSHWSSWRVVQDKGAKLCVEPGQRKIIIGRHRRPISVSEARGLFAHEVLIHACRAKEGKKQSKDLEMGLPDYMAAEEGLGVLIESSINGGIADKVKDRYIDIALALGGKLRRPFSRSEMYNFCFVRSIMRGLDRDEESDVDEVEAATWEHVNRIYRGSLGNHYVGVFTKDVTYYKGLIKIANYLERHRAKKGLPELMQYVMQGKFDPTNTTHRQTVKRGKKTI